MFPTTSFNCTVSLSNDLKFASISECVRGELLTYVAPGITGLEFTRYVIFAMLINPG